MRRSLSPIAVSLAVSAFFAGAAGAAEDTEARLRDALRQAITQQRSMEDELVRLRAKAAEDDKIIGTLKAQVAGGGKPTQPTSPDKAILERMEAEFNRRLAAQNDAIARAAETLDKWKAAYQDAATVARTKEAERAQLAGQTAGLTQRAESCEAKNAALFKVGNDILDRLKNISVAEAMAAHEPFVGTKRVELQNLTQDDEDKLREQKVIGQTVSRPE